jgi:TATA-binding protein-associated factor
MGDDARAGGLLALQHLVQSLQTDLVPYSLLIVVPLMGRMSDPLGAVRGMASHTFATVVALLPLAQGAAVPAGLDKEQLETLERERTFLSQLLDGGKADDYAAPVSLKNEAVLRRYQQEGVNWLAFLKRFGLHGVLADDMGLGKTLQSTMIMAASTAEARQAFATTTLPSDAPRPHLIVCPATLVSHWPHEIDKFVDSSILSALRYGGTPAQRAQQRSSVKDHDVVVMSYESLRSDADWIASQQWMYCILDEGHAIRNPNSAVSKAAKRIRAQHRLVLSGTPIQNSVLELWAIFDFLMPGFLGSHRSFNAKYGKALAEARGTVSISDTTNTSTTNNRKTKASTQKAVESGLLALEGLHRQVMPFVLRRTKDQVLSDLPPKIIQDVLCELSPLQRILYEQFSASQALKEVEGVVSGDAASGGGGGTSSAAAPHVFQALQYLRKLCSHPALVLDRSLPQHENAVAKALHLRHASSSSSSSGGKDTTTTWDQSIQRIKHDVSHAPKLMALKELLIDCGVARSTGDNDLGSSSRRHAKKEEEEDGIIQGGIQEDAGHRVLVFAQLRSLLDIVEEFVLKPLGITSLRLDGGVPVASRFERVQQFNSDPTIGVMLLTTAVGGLGLNLTAADTVVFLEHDWNPMADLQAMDRAHRLGQRRTVNVYRLLVAGTLEEKVMSLQRFKLDVAATVVNSDNVSLAAMDTDNLLDLFTVEEEGGGKKKVEVGGGEGGEEEGGGGKKKRGGLDVLMESLGDVAAAEGQYAEEFDLASFTAKLK